MLLLSQGQIYSGALFITVIFDWNLYASIIFILVITVIYTLIGALANLLSSILV